MFEVKTPPKNGNSGDATAQKGNGRNGATGGNGKAKTFNDLIFKLATGLRITGGSGKEKTHGMKDLTVASPDGACLAVEHIMKTGVTSPAYADLEKSLAKGFLGC
ncbi:MAG: hypothetical protein WC506_02700 [Candidatus Micrarchaeia archaeon]